MKTRISNKMWTAVLFAATILLIFMYACAPTPMPDGSVSYSETPIAVQSSTSLKTEKDPAFTFYRTTDTVNNNVCYWVPGASPTCLSR